MSKNRDPNADKIKTVMLIIPKLFPVPDVKGGGVELLITHLLNENEKHQLMRLIVTSIYDEEARDYTYHNSTVYYFKNNKSIDSPWKYKYYFWSVVCFFQRAIRKLFRNNITITDRFLAQCKSIAKKEHVDVLILENVSATDRYKPIINYVGRQNTYLHIHYHRKEEFAERQMVPNSISISNFVRNEWAKSVGISGKNEVLYNCVDIGKYQTTVSESTKEKMKTEIGFAKDDIVVVFCGRIIPQKGVKELLDAFVSIREDNIKLLLIGSAYYTLKNESEYSKSIVERANNMKNVVYLGYIPNEHIQDYYLISDIQVVPSIWQEGAGLVAIEGMASGLPLIVTDSGGMVEYVSDDCAIKVAIDSSLSNNLASEIVKLSKDSELRKKMGKAGRKRAERFSTMQYYEDFVRIVCE